MEERIEKLEEFAADAKARLVRIEARLDGMDGRFDGIDRRFNDIDRRFDGIDKRLDGIEDRMVTKADLAAGLATLEVTMLKWFMATAITLTSLVFVVVRFVK
jgi:hypothetical protein